MNQDDELEMVEKLIAAIYREINGLDAADAMCALTSAVSFIAHQHGGPGGVAVVAKTMASLADKARERCN